MAPTLRDLGEDALLARILPLYAGDRVDEVGPGDDAAVIATSGSVVATTDTMVRGRDWLDEWSTPADVAHKAFAQNVADIASMGARPLSLLISLAADPLTEVAWAEEFARGLGEVCAAHDVTVAGGDLSSAPPGVIVLSVTALGDLEGRPAVLRSGAQPGDVVAVAGTLGRSAAGLMLLTDGVREADGSRGQALAVHRRPSARIAEGLAAADAEAHAMLDLSDGLSRDGHRMARASSVRLELDSDLLDGDRAWLSEVVGEARAASCLFGGGEEHSLLAAFALGASLPPQWRPIGRVGARRSGEAPGVTLDGAPLPVQGWDHFTD